MKKKETFRSNSRQAGIWFNRLCAPNHDVCRGWIVAHVWYNMYTIYEEEEKKKEALLCVSNKTLLNGMRNLTLNES